ncbi:unnamed protein product, partial [Effrenium voratum]
AGLSDTEGDQAVDAESLASSASRQLPVSFTLSKASSCMFCNCRSTDKSPLPHASEGDVHGGCVPWGKYRKIRDSEGVLFRVPEGRVDLICLNVWRLRGLAHKYDNMGGYMKVVNAGRQGQELHQSFLSARSEWLRLHAKNPKLKLKDKESLKKVKATLETVSRSRVRFKKPKQEFVSVHDWDPAIDGEFDESKVTAQTICGEVVRGIFKNVGRKGVYKVEDYEDKALEERGLEHDDEGPFAAEGLRNKKEALAGVFAEAAKEREAAAVAAPQVLSLNAVLEVLQLQHLPAPVQTQAQQKKLSARALTKMSEPKAGQATGESQAFSLDGRGLRLKESLRRQAQDLKQKLAQMMDFGEDYDFEDKRKAAGRQKSLQSFKTNLATQLKRVENSANKAGVSEEVEQLQTLTQRTERASSLNSCLTQAAPSSEDFLEAVQAVCKLESLYNAKVGHRVWRKLLEAKCHHHMLYREYKSYAGLFEETCLEAGMGFPSTDQFGEGLGHILGRVKRSGPQVKNLLATQPRDLVQELVEMEVEHRLTALLRALPPTELCKESSDARTLIKQFCAQIMVAGSSGVKLLERVSKSAEIVHGLLQSNNLQLLAEAVDGVTKLTQQAGAPTDGATDSEAAVSDVGASQIAAFFQKHTVGVAILGNAKEKVKTSQQSLAN